MLVDNINFIDSLNAFIISSCHYNAIFVVNLGLCYHWSSSDLASMSDGLLVELMDASALLGLSPVFALSLSNRHSLDTEDTG